jgi:pectin methylesterase-like acyl-CoA thioesterase
MKAGTYQENVEVPPYKTNVALVGEGATRRSSQAAAAPPTAGSIPIPC